MRGRKLVFSMYHEASEQNGYGMKGAMDVKLVICTVIFAYCLAHGFARCSKYGQRSPKACGRTLTAYRGEVKSPGYPHAYPPAVRDVDRVCTWIIAVPEGRGVKITLPRYNLNYDSKEDQYDELQIFSDGACNDKVSSYIGNDTETTVINVPTNMACVRFVRRASENIGHNGFTLSYEVISATGECGANQTVLLVTSDEGYIYSPGYPSSSYPQGLDCTWLIQTDPEQIITVTFLDFQLSYTTSCDYATDFVQIGNNNDTYDFKYCASNKPERFESSGNQVWLSFQTGRWTNKGFWLKYQTLGRPLAADPMNSGLSRSGGAAGTDNGLTGEAPSDGKRTSSTGEQPKSRASKLQSPFLALSLMLFTLCFQYVYL
ncbi:cubilin-like isoform X2 [Branchiostoma floridae]|uniref:Cubilin-like isoform X2 n=1 Tax=Branchiostoma floridae TaxID=7739 RepID=A0A9J7MGX5_BRAFL|nr:cubilin-like isoform X2 [Branchiostoma floridae]